MRCPKCHYISFDAGQRCRNCGYDFSLTADSARSAVDLPIATADAPEGPLSDFAFEAVRPAPARAPDTGADLPLFSRSSPGRAAAAPAPAAPRPPLAVRRANPAAARARVPDEPTLDLGMPDTIRSKDRLLDSARGDVAEARDSRTASLLTRIGAAVLDLILMGSIHLAVVYLTLRLCGLTTSELRLLPPVPLAAFLLMLTTGYMICFTVASGQTIGKMATGIRVVPAAEQDPGNGRLSLGRAIVRAAGCVASLLLAGLGYLPALLSADHRALHDRLAETRVVRA